MVECPVVQTLTGQVKGRVCLKAKPKEAKQVYNYAGIPFAKPPVGELRFEPPQKCDSWTGIYEATTLAPAPVQDMSMGKNIANYFIFANEFGDDLERTDEDCLYLNVFTSNPQKTANMPVLFWIYGGALQTGSAGGYSGQALCGLNDVVLVVPNYRLNIFGFFTTGRDTDYPGNMGMLDQIKALEWVRDNIRNFGGNPDNVTIFGESAGAVSVSMHMLSPMSKGLFHKAIQHSGTANFPMLVKEDFSGILKQHLEELEITETEPDGIVKKLKSLSTQFVVEESMALAYGMVSFGVAINGRFLEDQPTTLMKGGSLAPVPSIVGCNSTEGSGILNLGQPPNFVDGYTEEDWTVMTKGSLPFLLRGKVNPDKLDEAFEVIKSVYDKEFSDDDKYKWSKITASISADSFFIAPTIEQGLAHSSSGHPTYFYQMRQRLRCHHDDEYAIEVKKKPEFCECDHGDDVTFTFGFPLISGGMDKKVKYSKDEEELSKSWMTYIANFAASGNPNCGRKVEFEWPKYDSKQQRYLTAKIPLEEGNHLIPSRYKLWMDTLPSL